MKVSKGNGRVQRTGCRRTDHVVRDQHSRLQLLRRSLAKELGDVEVDEISVVKNNRLDRALDFVTFVTVGRDHMQHFRWNAVFISEGDTAERVAKLPAKFSLNNFARFIFVVLERFANIG